MATDLATLTGRTLLVVTDYFSDFIKVSRLNTTFAKATIRALKEIFSRFGIPEELCTDNGPQFTSWEFQAFAKEWGFKHTTSSPRYPLANGKAEHAVKLVKRMFRKCEETGQSEFFALLDW